MKQVTTHLNEQEYKLFSKVVQKQHTSDYGLTKKLIRELLESEKAIVVNLWFYCVCVGLTVTTILVSVLA
jgi:hypothetical protein